MLCEKFTKLSLGWQLGDYSKRLGQGAASLRKWLSARLQKGWGVSCAVCEVPARGASGGKQRCGLPKGHTFFLQMKSANP